MPPNSPWSPYGTPMTSLQIIEAPMLSTARRQAGAQPAISASARQTGLARTAAGPGPVGSVCAWAAIRSASSSRVGPSGTSGRQPSA